MVRINLKYYKLQMLILFVCVLKSQVLINDPYPLMIYNVQEDSVSYHIVSYSYYTAEFGTEIKDTLLSYNSDIVGTPKASSKDGRYILFGLQQTEIRLFDTYENELSLIQHGFFRAWVYSESFLNTINSKIVFAATVNDTSVSGLYLYDIDQNTITPLIVDTTNLMYTSLVDISPEDQKFLYWQRQYDGKTKLYLGDFDSPEFVEIDSVNVNNSISGKIHSNTNYIYVRKQNNMTPGIRSLRLKNISSGANSLIVESDYIKLGLFGFRTKDQSLYYYISAPTSSGSRGIYEVDLTSQENFVDFVSIPNPEFSGSGLQITSNEKDLYWNPNWSSYHYFYNFEDQQVHTIYVNNSNGLVGFKNRNMNELNPDDIGVLSDIINDNSLTWISNPLELGEQVWNANGRLISLSIENMGLFSIPTSIQQLLSLSKLDLSNNDIHIIPEEIRYLDNLKKIDLSYNLIDSIHTNAFWYLDNLVYINLSNNEIDYLPISISSSELIDTVIVSNNGLNILNNFQTHPLSYLDVSNNNLTSMNGLCGVTLKASNNDIQNIQYVGFEYQNIDLENNNIESISDSIAFLQYLGSLNIGNNFIHELPVSFSVMDSLSILHLDSNYLYCENGEQNISSIPTFLSDGSIDIVIGLYDQLCNQVSISNEYFLPEKFRLHQNYPNPFNPGTNIIFDIPELSHVKLNIYDLLGREVKELLNKNLNGGIHSVRWDGKDKYGRNFSSGMYLYSINAISKETDKQYHETRKMVLMK